MCVNTLVSGGVKESGLWNRLFETEIGVTVDELVRAKQSMPRAQQ